MSQLGRILLIFSGLSFLCFVSVRVLLGAWVPFLWLALGFFVIFLIWAVWLDRRFYREFFGMKTTRQGLSMGTMIVLVLTALVAINFLGARRYKTWDLSAAKVNSLSDQSIKVLDNLQEDLRIIYFYKEGTEGVEQNRKMFIELLKKYQDQSPRVKLEFSEINANPALAEKYEIKKGTQSVLLEYQGRTNQIEKVDEQEITGAIVKVFRAESKKVYLLSGHGELGLEPRQDGDSATMLKSQLEGNRYEVKNFSFSTDSSIPKDADVLMILGPQQQFLDSEVKALESYLAAGGSLFLSLEPKAKHGLTGFVNALGVKLEDNYIISVVTTPFGQVPDQRFTRGSVFSTANPITKPFPRNEFTVFRFPQVLSRMSANPPVGYAIDDLVRSGENSFTLSSLNSKDKGPDGPFTIVMDVRGKYAAAGSTANPDAKEFDVVIAGDREFLNDQSLGQNLNRDLLLNSMAALAKEENMISITPKEVGKTEMVMVDTQFILYILMFAIPLPLALYTWSFVLWWRRRSA